jgi:signal transduction histidine kinase
LGFDPHAAPGPEQGHFGLSSMHERAAALGGGFSVHSEPGKGARITISLPQTNT